MDRALLIEAMRATAGMAPEPVDVPGWGRLYVKTMTAADVTRNMRDKSNGVDDDYLLVRGVARVLCDEHGTLVFDPQDPDDLALLAKQPWPMLRRITERASAINALTAESQEEAGNVSPPDRNSSSTSASNGA